MSKTGYRPVVVIRRLLLAALALFLGGVVAIFIFNRLGDQRDSEDPVESGLGAVLADIILSGKGFDYEVTDGEQRLFHIRADRILADRDNVVTLEGIVLTVERDSGEIYELAAKTGSYRSKANRAVVEGDVVVTGPDGVVIRGPKFELLKKGTVVKSRGPITFAAGRGISGSANEIEAFLEKDQFQLAGKVKLFSAAAAGAANAGLSLDAKQVFYDKPGQLVHAEGEVRLLRGRDELTCKRIAVTLSEGDSNSRFVRARWDVAGTLVSNDPRGFERQLRFWGEEVSIDYGEEGSEPRAAEIKGDSNTPARFDQADETGQVRRFSARRIEAIFDNGQLKQARTSGPMTMTEFMSFDPTRELGRVCGGSAVAKFRNEGDLLELKVRRGIDLHRPGLQVTGDTLTTLGETLIQVDGKPAHVYTSQGELSASELSYRTETRDLKASGGVRAWFPPGGDFTMVSATKTSENMPIQVMADTAEWAQGQGRFEFEGGVRAWQGESFLTAAVLIGENGDRIRGEGGVQTTLERDVSVDEEGETQPRDPVRVTADSFDYMKDQGLITYKGTPEVQDSGRMMSCDEMSVYLGDSSGLDRLECIGNTLIDDRIGGRKVRGSDALYRPDDSKVEVTGSPVTLQNPDGAVIRSSIVVYDFETSTAQFRSASSTAVKGPGADSAAGADSADSPDGGER